MRLQPQLYIDTSGNPLGEPTFERVEFFDFESIEITSTVQDFRDISKVFTDYSKTFNVPASRTNNKIFRHYYNSSIIDGFDARIKQKAEIHINGILFKVGYLRLTKSLIANGKPKSYSVTFFGSLTNLSNVIGNAELSDLSDLNIYNHSYDKDTVYDGFTQGLELYTDPSTGETSMSNGNDRDIIYPAISANDKWFYDSSGVSDPQDTEYNQGVSVNLYDNTPAGTTYGINYLALKPAIKVRHIIDAIQEKYSSIVFSDDFFGNEEFDDLYMLLHNNKGVLAPESDSTEIVSNTYRIGTNSYNSDFDYVSGTDRRPMITKWDDLITKVRVHQYHVIVEVTPATGQENRKYDIEILEDGVAIERFLNIEGDSGEKTAVLCTENVKEWDNVSVRVSSEAGELSSFGMTLQLKSLIFKVNRIGVSDEYICDVANFNDTPTTDISLFQVSNQTLLKRIEITRNIPKMKILDFLTGIFKMFNLTALPQVDGSLKVQTLNQFYTEGNTIDITNKVDTEEIGVNRMDLFKNIEFEFSDPKTFGILKNNEILNADFGNLEYQSTPDGTDSSLIFDGKDYKVKLPFEKMLFERLTDEGNDRLITAFGHGWLADKDQNDVLTKPILFYNVVQSIEDSITPMGFISKGLITQYNRPSNTNASEYQNGSSTWITVEGTKSLNFNTEFDEFSFTEVNRSLFRKYYQNYISSVFDKSTRVFDLEMKADLAFLLKYNINDTLTIKGEEFLINNIRTNLNTGLTKLELILKFFIEEADCLIGDLPLTKPTGLIKVSALDSSVRFSWDASPSGDLIKGYMIYVDDVLIESTLSLGTNYTISNLEPETEYKIEVKSYNCNGDESALSDSITVTTGNQDAIPPDAPTNLTIVSLGINEAVIDWEAASTGVSAAGYYVYVDGVTYPNATTPTTYTSTEATLSLLAGSTYEVYVKAFDDVTPTPNYSEASNRINVKPEGIETT